MFSLTRNFLKIILYKKKRPKNNIFLPQVTKEASKSKVILKLTS